MNLSINKQDLVKYITLQLNHFFPDGNTVREADIGRHLDLTFDRVGKCFAAVKNRYFQEDGQTRFNHLHQDQYAMFLYFLANTLYRHEADVRICEKLFYLNKLLNGIDAFYEVQLPDIFLFCHPLGTILGRAQYADYFLVFQECTIGAAREATAGMKSVFPVLEKYCAIYKGSAILGNCHVAANCKISAHSLLIDQDLEANKIYIGTKMNHVIKENKGPDHIWGVS